MEWLAIGLGLFNAGTGLFGSNEQKKVDDAQVELEYEDNLEKIRRRAFEQEQTEGAAKAFSETAGVLHTGGSSAQGFLDTMSREFEYELNWMKSYAKEARELGHKRAKVGSQTGKLSAITGGINTGLNVYSSFG